MEPDHPYSVRLEKNTIRQVLAKAINVGKDDKNTIEKGFQNSDSF